MKRIGFSAMSRGDQAAVRNLLERHRVRAIAGFGYGK